MVDVPLIYTELAQNGPDEGKGSQTYARLVINQVDKKVNYRVLLIPFRFGDKLPVIQYTNNNTATVTRNGKTNKVTFSKRSDNRTEIKVL